MSLQKPKAVYAANERQYTAADGEVQAYSQYSSGVFTSDGKRNKEIDWYTDWWSKRSSAWALSLGGHQNGSFQITAKPYNAIVLTAR